MKYLLTLIILIPICLYANVINVNHDGSGDYTTIQEGIDNANPGDTVLVFPGNYIETIDFLGKDIVVGSLFLTTQNHDFIDATIIDGNGQNSQLVKFVNGETNATRLVGFIITNAYYSKNNHSDDWYPGLAICIFNSSPCIENNRIIDNNYSSQYEIGGGMGIMSSSSKIINNTISNNDGAFYGGGIYIANSSDIVIQGNIISYHETNSGYGVSQGCGLYADSSQNVLISGNEIFENHGYADGGGITLFRCEDVRLINNDIYDNGSVQAGGLYAQESEVTLINNLIHDNNTSWGAGGVYFQGNDALLVNNTICNNGAQINNSWGGGMACDDANVSVYNTIFYGNIAADGSQIYLYRLADPDFYYCDIEGGINWFGLNDTVSYDGVYENNINLDPLFFLSGDHPYALQLTSPCINAGTSDTTGLQLPESDITGYNRVFEGIIDIGAYECQTMVSVPEAVIDDDILVYPNPTTGKVIISMPGREFETAEVFVEDLSGNRVFQTMIMQNETAIDLSLLKAGIYLVRIELSGDEFVSKIVIY